MAEPAQKWSEETYLAAWQAQARAARPRRRNGGPALLDADARQLRDADIRRRFQEMTGRKYARLRALSEEFPLSVNHIAHIVDPRNAPPSEA